MQLHPQNAARSKQGKLVAKAAVAAAAAAVAARRPPPLLLRRHRRRASSVAPPLSAASASGDGGGGENEKRRRPPHAVLGVPASASAAEARRAWRARALEVHPDILAAEGSRSGSGTGAAAAEGGAGETELQLELNEAYAAFLRLLGVRSRGAVGKRGGAREEGEAEAEEDEEEDPFLPPLFSSSSPAGGDGPGERRAASFLFVDPFSVPNFDPFRWRELQALLVTSGRGGGGVGGGGGGGGGGTTEDLLLPTPETAADVALAALCRAGVTRMPPRRGVALLTEGQLAAVERIIESCLEKMDLAGGALAVSEALARARVANSGWRRPRSKGTREEGRGRGT